MPAALGQANKGATASATSQATGSMATQATGSLMIGGGVYQGTFSALTDNKLNSPYVQVDAERTVDTPNAAKMRLYYYQNALGGAGHTVTLATTTAQPITTVAAEFTGMLTVGALDVSNGGNDASSPFGNAVSITPTAGRRVLVALFGGNSGSNPATQAETQGFTVISAAQELNGATFWTACLAYKIVTADGVTAYTAQFTESGATEGAVILAAFKELSQASMGARRATDPRLWTIRNIRAQPTRSFASAPANLSLSIDTPGAIAVSGQSMSVSRGVALATPGAITILGQAVVPALTIPVTSGTVALAGQSVTATLGVALGAGSITVQGQSVTPSLVAQLAAGALTVAGQSVTATLGVAVSAGAISLDGQSVTLAAGGNLSLALDVGAIAVAGQSVAATLGLAVTGGATTLAGQSLTVTHGLALGAGAIAIDGQLVAAQLIGNVSLSVEAGQITLTGQSIAADLTQSLQGGGLASLDRGHEPDTRVMKFFDLQRPQASTEVSSEASVSAFLRSESVKSSAVNNRQREALALLLLMV